VTFEFLPLCSKSECHPLQNVEGVHFIFPFGILVWRQTEIWNGTPQKILEGGHSDLLNMGKVSKIFWSSFYPPNKFLKCSDMQRVRTTKKQSRRTRRKHLRLWNVPPIHFFGKFQAQWDVEDSAIFESQQTFFFRITRIFSRMKLWRNSLGSERLQVVLGARWVSNS